MEDTQPEILISGPLAEILRENATDPDDNVIEEVFITGDDDDRMVSAKSIAVEMLNQSMRGFAPDKIHKEVANSSLLEVAKSIIEGSTQNDSEVGSVGTVSEGLSEQLIVEPPYPPELLSSFLEVDETHFRCVKAKQIDSVGREFTLKPMQTSDGMPFDASDVKDEEKNQIADEIKAIRAFIMDANDIIGFNGVNQRVAMDYEGIGWGAYEVIRSVDMKVRKLAHIPASRIRVLRGWHGFVERVGGTPGTVGGSGTFTYYQMFGRKVVSKDRKDPISGKGEPYNPLLDGELTPGNLEWDLVDRSNGKPTNSFAKSANEVIWVPKHHSNTIYYGFSDIVPALGSVLANVHIRDFLLQFFEHNTVPRYAIIIEGAKLATGVQEAIMKYFSAQVKGKAHKTLIIPVPSMRGEVKVRFEKLAADTTEGSFQETRKNNAQSILTAHGVSPAIIGIADAANLGSGKGLSQAEIYKDRIITPSQRRFEEVLNKLFMLGLGVQMVALKFKPLDIRDLKAEMEVFAGYLEKGAITLNEVRQLAGLGDPLEGGNRPFILTKQGIRFIDELSEATSEEMAAMSEEIGILRAGIVEEDRATVQAKADEKTGIKAAS